MSGFRLSIGVLAVAACVASAGCGRSALFTGERAQLDDGVNPGDGDGDVHPLPGDAGDEPPNMDSGLPKPPPSDGGVPDDAGMDAGPDADVIDDAGNGDAGDATIIDPDPIMCSPVYSEPYEQFGTTSEPYEHPLSAGPLEGDVDWRGRAFIRITGVTPGESYALVLAGDQLDLAVFDAEDWLGHAECISDSTLIGCPAVCTVTASESTLDVTVHALSAIRHFELKILPASEPQGTREAPHPIALSELPRELRTAPDQPSFYEITGVDPATTYIVKGTSSATQNLRLAVFPEGYMRPAEVQLTPGGAIGQPLGTSLFIAVFGPSPDAPVTLEVTPATREAEGSADAPVTLDIGDLPYEGETGWAYNNDTYAPAGRAESASYYAITGLTPGVEYLVSLAAQQGVQLYVYDSETITDAAQPQCMTYIAQDGLLQCGALATSSTLYVMVASYAGDGVPLTLAIEPSPYITEGTELAPVELILPDFPYGGEVLATETSHYRVSGLTADHAYLLRIFEQTTQAARLVVIDGLTSRTLCELSALDGPMQCIVKPAGRSVIVRVGLSLAGDPARPPGGTFTLDFDEIDERPTSSLDEPILLECSEGIARSLLSATGSSYFVVRGLDPDVAYIVEAYAQAAYYLEVYPTRADTVSGGECVVAGDPTLPARCLARPEHGSILIHVTSDALGEPIDLVVRRAHDGSEGSEAAPIAASIDQLPLAGQVATARSSFYTLRGLSIGAKYTAQVASAQEPVLVEPYVNVPGSFPQLDFVAYPGEPGELDFTATHQTLTFQLTLPEPSDWITDISIDLLPR